MIAEAPFYKDYKPNLSLRDRTAALHSRLGEVDLEECRAEGRAMTFEQAVEYSLEDATSSRLPKQRAG
jgi:hypothetical protein